MGLPTPPSACGGKGACPLQPLLFSPHPPSPTPTPRRVCSGVVLEAPDYEPHYSAPVPVGGRLTRGRQRWPDAFERHCPCPNCWTQHERLDEPMPVAAEHMRTSLACSRPAATSPPRSRACCAASQTLTPTCARCRRSSPTQHRTPSRRVPLRPHGAVHQVGGSAQGSAERAARRQVGPQGGRRSACN